MSKYLQGESFQVPRKQGLWVRLSLATLLTALAIFTVLPITQLISGDPRERLQIRSVDLSIPPPPPPPPEPPSPPEDDPKQDQPELESPPQQLDLSQLESVLNPGIGGAMAAFTFDSFAVAPDIQAELQIFSISDLDQRPGRIRVVQPQFPPDFVSRGPRGIVRVKIMIDETGAVSIMEVVEASHQEAVQPVRQALVRWRFEPPVKDGQRVRAYYIQPIEFDYSN